MNVSPVMSESDTPRAARVRHRALLRWRTHGAETAAVALGTAAVAVQWARPGPARWLTDEAAVALAVTRAGGPAVEEGVAAPAGSPAWWELLALGHRLGLTAPGGWYAGALALLCFAGTLYAAAGTVRALHGRRAWPFVLAVAGFVAVSPPALGWLFSGTGGALSLLTLTLLVRAVVGAAVRGRLARVRTALVTALLAGLGGLASPAGLALGAVYPAALVLAGRRRGSRSAALRGGAVHAGVWASACAVAWPTGGGLGEAAAFPGVAASVEAGWSVAAGWWSVGLAGPAAAALGACAAGRLPVPVRLAAVVVGAAVLLAPGAALPAGVAPALCGGLLLSARGAAARLVGGTALCGAVTLLWMTTLGRTAGLVLAGCAVVVVAARQFPAPASLRLSRPRPVFRGHAPARRGRARWPLRAAAGTAAPWALLRRGARTSSRTVALGAAVAGTLLAGWGPATPAPWAGTTDALCFTEARYGHVFAEYARRLGLRRSTVALASPGGTLTLGKQQALDLRGRTDPQIAAARAADDDAALRRYLFVRARPEFVHVGPEEAARTGLTAGRLAAHGYRPLLRQGAGGDYVHRSAVTVPERLPELRAWARAATAPPHGCAPTR